MATYDDVVPNENTMPAMGPIPATPAAIDRRDPERRNPQDSEPGKRTNGGTDLAPTNEIGARALEWLSGGTLVEGLGDFAFRAFVDDLPETVLWFDPAGVLVYANTSWFNLSGYTPETSIGRPFVDMLDPTEVDEQLDRFERLRRLTPDDRVLVEEFRSAKINWISVVNTAWFDADGNLTGFSAVGRDRSEARRAQEATTAANKRLEESNRDLQDFAYVASHDLQEPLRKISAFGDRLATKHSHQLDEKGLDYLDRVQGASSRMQRLISDLLSFSRVATQFEPSRPVPLSAVLDEVIQDLEIALTEADATVTVSELPIVPGDPTQMHQLFQNLIGNAVKFRAADRRSEISVSARSAPRPGLGEESVLSRKRQSETGWLIAVADNGIGFDEKYLSKIFTVFQRLHGRNEYSGSGVGLSVCRRIVERHHGEVIAASTPGQGSTFSVWLPALAS